LTKSHYLTIKKPYCRERLKRIFEERCKVISFELTEEQKALQEMAHSFAEKEMRPKAAYYDRGKNFLKR
jgi:hypothetical protein